jgi:hypothetical protein
MLNASLGAATLGEILRAQLASIDKYCEGLQAATRRAQWTEAARIAGEIANESANLGFRSLTSAARGLAAATSEKVDVHTLRNGAQMVVFEYERLRLAIAVEFPELLV